MGWLRKILGKRPEQPGLDHVTFGETVAYLDCGNGLYEWEADAVPSSQGLKSVFFKAPAEGPSESQVKFWAFILDNLAELKARAAEALQARLCDFQMEDAYCELEWGGAGLPEDGQFKSDWDLHFSNPRDRASMTVYFRNGEPLPSSSYDR